MTRRGALRSLLAWTAGSPILRPQQPGSSLPDRMPAIDEMVNVFDFEPLLKARIPKDAYDYIAGGADDEWTIRRNRKAFSRILLRPRFLVDVSKLDLSLDLFGQRIEMPILISPTGAHQRAHPEGELATARAAGAARTIMAVSSNSSYPIDKIAEAATGTLWFQLYVGPDRESTRERVERAVAAGCKAVCYTVDGALGAHRERNLRNRIAQSLSPGIGPQGPNRMAGRRRTPAPPARYGLQPGLAAELDWSYLDELNAYAKVPVLLKGILTAEDARLGLQRGAAGILVSNHGGRNLDTNPATIEVLPEIVDAVGGKIPVLIDGGFRRGTDVLKALAIGAKAVMVGRPPFWGLGAFGQAGVQRVLELMQTELARAMGLAGRPTLASIDRRLVRIER
jgi:4-hydroxymandelate oxidase